MDIDRLLMGMASQLAEREDHMVVEDLRGESLYILLLRTSLLYLVLLAVIKINTLLRLCLRSA